MSYHAATLQYTFEKTASAIDFSYTAMGRLYWLDDNTNVQPFSWTSPRLRGMAINGLYWELVTLIDVSFWLIDTTLQFISNSKFKILTEKPDILEAESIVPLRLPRWSRCH